MMQMATGTSGVAVAQGMQFEYFDEVRKKIEEARQEVFFIDPYLDVSSPLVLDHVKVEFLAPVAAC
jgi:hypothetical protein